MRVWSTFTLACVAGMLAPRSFVQAIDQSSRDEASMYQQSSDMGGDEQFNTLGNANAPINEGEYQSGTTNTYREKNIQRERVETYGEEQPRTYMERREVRREALPTGFHLQRARRFVGEPLTDANGYVVGVVKDVAIADNGLVNFVIVDYCTDTGLGQKFMAVPWAAVTPRFGRTRLANRWLALDMTRDQLLNAPSFAMGNWPDLSNREYVTTIDRFYGVTSAQLMGEPISGEREAGGTVLRAQDQIIGSELLDQNGKAIGRVRDLLIDNRTGQVAFAVVRFNEGALPNAHGEFAALPWSILQTAQNNRFQLRCCQDKIASETFAFGNWPDLRNRDWVQREYQHYGQPLYWEHAPSKVQERERTREFRSEQHTERQRMGNERMRGEPITPKQQSEQEGTTTQPGMSE